ncbi:FAD-dependent oxidoreductase [Rhodococcus sp. BP-252]|uniref:hydroxysqualene dehydroxylase n=1 Tax=unclassified Rhodococcus (in: high G+C Gram-positive bacteria) TaxID=192944 RepID=UPI001C9B8E81|nr:MULTISPECIES: FAD-dependent oxidoreductase [unclassified Rhodococcus (in: high G+C Gram-positive bacteria)]MBY6411836.1 FAD-dependent oxidoreductase [Rhodococcus sp. BP-320]MBY6416536.1 FAD-dependent oxidoreductase [Rhodococcus sp. BP-321]MBY6420658.1 FAD-dependent oxidoreductase [Rhodococcus sp. BP-324]MBY6426560.1 FAD-dependent oxidoreductase [Rhodococcus sp. BP-323]MBY6431559.1 FAD-dependent oxidoreductase [Rhodococcus sp. BP-322]
MNDRRRVVHEGPDGYPSAASLASVPRVAVIGGGIAGLSAATALAERGVSVTVFEKESYLGGRVGGWSTVLDDGSPATMSRGFHAFFRQYYNLRNLLRRTDPDLSRLHEVEDYPLIDGSGRVDGFKGLPSTPGLNAFAFVGRSPTFRLRDLFSLNAVAALPLMTVSVPGIYEQLDEVPAAEFLRRINFPEPARHLAFGVFSRSFFADPEEMSAAELAMMFHLYFLGSSEGLVFDVPVGPYPQSLWEPLGEYLTGLGVDIRLGAAVKEISRGFDVDGEKFDAVVLATDIGGLQKLTGSLGTAAWRSQVAGLQNTPPFLVHRVWLDKPVNADRPAFIGTGGMPPIDNISVLERFEDEAAEWAGRTGGSVVELHAYAATESEDVTREQLMARMHEIYPETALATVVDSRTEWRDDCPLFGLGAFAGRPTVRTPEPGLVLAGDGIRIDLPVALMERAATTGLSAANTLLSGWGIAGHDILTVPVRGRYRVFDALASLRQL